MAIEAQSIAIWRDGHAEGDAPPQLIDALQDFAKSRATRRLYREAEARKVRCDLRVPLVKDCRVRADQLGRAVRKVYRSVIDTAEPGEGFTIDFLPGPDSTLVVQATRGRVLSF